MDPTGVSYPHFTKTDCDSLMHRDGCRVSYIPHAHPSILCVLHVLHESVSQFLRMYHPCGDGDPVP